MEDFQTFLYDVPLIVKIIIGIPVTALLVFLTLLAPIQYTRIMIRLIKRGRK